MRRALIAAAAAAALCAPLSVAGSAAAGTVTVRGLEFPDASNTYLTYFGCDDLYHADTRAPQVRIDLGGAPAGDRSFALLMPGSRTAAGPVHKVASVADTTVAGMQARSHTGGEGVAYVWYVTSKLQPGQVWAGRTVLSATSSWRYVNTAAATYEWDLLDAATGEEVRDGGSSTIGDFTDANGDGPGYMLAGFGCDGDFSIDALRYGSRGNVTTYDLEGISTTATMDPKRPVEVEPGEAVKLSGSTESEGTMVGASMVLQAKPAGAAKFTDVGGPVPPSTDGLVHQVVKPKVTTTYRWYVPEQGYTSAAYSRTVRVVVIAAEPEPSQTDPPAGDPPGESSDASDGGASGGESGGSDDLEVPPLPTQSPSEPESPSEAPDGGAGGTSTSEPDPQSDPQPTETPTVEATTADTGESTDATP